MATELKFNDVAKRTALQKSTLQYVLKSGLVPGTPEGGSQGQHRRFTVGQAIWISVCTALVMAGVSLEQAALAIEFCEATVRGTARYGRRVTYHSNLPFDGFAWKLELLDRRFVHVYREDVELEDRSKREWVYLDLESGKAKRHASELAPIIRVEIDLTGLEDRLAK